MVLNRLRRWLPALLLPLVVGCATGGAANPRDPLEPFNRAVYQFNDTVDSYALKPVAQGYQKYVPLTVQLVVTSFFSNFEDLYTGANNLLQAKPRDALVDVTRFVVNSTLGFAGFADVASAIGMPKHSEDFGQTLGRWGVPSGPYLVIPLLGPSTIRDAPARAVDIYASPTSQIFSDVPVRNSMFGLRLVSDRASLLEAEKVILGAALDPYSLIRDGWLQRRRNAIYDGDPPEVPPLEDDSGYSDDSPYPDDSGYLEEREKRRKAKAAGEPPRR
jgi:phospholipid-binding lipoprotein MlaA